MPTETTEPATPNQTDSVLTQGNYDFNYRVFPEDLGGQTYNGHYMVINISVSSRTNMQSVTGPNRKEYKISTPDGSRMSKRDMLRYQIDPNFKGQDGQTSLGGGDIRAWLPKPKRIKESIALYMPNADLTFNDTHDYENISLTKFAAQAGMTWGGAALGSLTALGTGSSVIGGAIAGALNNASNSLGGAMQGAQIGGFPINPRVEVLFSNTLQREFSFDFLFSPVSENESKVVHEIIRTIRFHAAPEQVNINLDGGFFNKVATAVEAFFWTPPSEFDITFYHRGKENTQIPRINTCVLTQIDVSYAPNGVYSTFHNGHPVQIRMMLRFRETEVNHKLKVLQGF